MTNLLDQQSVNPKLTRIKVRPTQTEPTLNITLYEI